MDSYENSRHSNFILPTTVQATDIDFHRSEARNLHLPDTSGSSAELARVLTPQPNEKIVSSSADEMHNYAFWRCLNVIS